MVLRGWGWGCWGWGCRVHPNLVYMGALAGSVFLGVLILSGVKLSKWSIIAPLGNEWQFE
jgi:hypothetical protein